MLDGKDAVADEGLFLSYSQREKEDRPLTCWLARCVQLGVFEYHGSCPVDARYIESSGFDRSTLGSESGCNQTTHGVWRSSFSLVLDLGEVVDGGVRR